MSAIYYVIAFAAGLGITLQTTLNSQLAKGLGGGSSHRRVVFLYSGGVQPRNLLVAARRVIHLPCCHSFAACMEPGGRAARCLCIIQLCRTRTENRFFSPARAGDCRTVTRITGDRPFWPAGRGKAASLVTEAGRNAGHAGRSRHHAFRRSALCTFSAVKPLPTFVTAQTWVSPVSAQYDLYLLGGVICFQSQLMSGIRWESVLSGVKEPAG